MKRLRGLFCYFVGDLMDGRHRECSGGWDGQVRGVFGAWCGVDWFLFGSVLYCCVLLCYLVGVFLFASLLSLECFLWLALGFVGSIVFIDYSSSRLVV